MPVVSNGDFTADQNMLHNAIIAIHLTCNRLRSITRLGDSIAASKGQNLTRSGRSSSFTLTGGLVINGYTRIVRNVHESGSRSVVAMKAAG